MQCSKCGNSQVIIKKHQSGQYLCKDCFIESIEKKVIKTVKKEKLLDKGDKVLVALSGGKDSVTTLEILNSFRKMNVIDICAVTVDEGIDNYRQEGVDPPPLAGYRPALRHHQRTRRWCSGRSLSIHGARTRHYPLSRTGPGRSLEPGQRMARPVRPVCISHNRRLTNTADPGHSPLLFGRPVDPGAHYCHRHRENSEICLSVLAHDALSLTLHQISPGTLQRPGCRPMNTGISEACLEKKD